MSTTRTYLTGWKPRTYFYYCPSIPDFKIDNGKFIELKSDAHITKNFFIELTSNTNKGTIGGPYQAYRHGSDYYMFWFTELENQPLFSFKTEDLLLWLKDNKDKYWKTKVKNKHDYGQYSSEGIVVPRVDLSEVYKLKYFK